MRRGTLNAMSVVWRTSILFILLSAVYFAPFEASAFRVDEEGNPVWPENTSRPVNDIEDFVLRSGPVAPDGFVACRVPPIPARDITPHNAYLMRQLVGVVNVSGKVDCAVDAKGEVAIFSGEALENFHLCPAFRGPEGSGALEQCPTGVVYSSTFGVESTETLCWNESPTLCRAYEAGYIDAATGQLTEAAYRDIVSEIGTRTNIIDVDAARAAGLSEREIFEQIFVETGEYSAQAIEEGKDIETILGEIRLDRTGIASENTFESELLRFAQSGNTSADTEYIPPLGNAEGFAQSPSDSSGYRATPGTVSSISALPSARSYQSLQTNGVLNASQSFVQQFAVADADVRVAGAPFERERAAQTPSSSADTPPHF